MAQMLVVGGGFRGIVASYLLCRAGHTVTLVERAPVLGGVLHADEWNGFFLDKGCHLFSNDGDDLTAVLLDIMQDRIVPVEFSYASIIEGQRSDGFAIPDLTTLGPEAQQRILYEVVAAAAAPQDEPETLQDLLIQRFGPAATHHLGRITRKMFRTGPENLDPSAVAATPFRRIKALPDPVCEFLKRLPELEDRLAASSLADPFRYVGNAVSKRSFRNFYPAERGMQGFCDSAERTLVEAGVKMLLGEQVTHLAQVGHKAACVFSSGVRAEFDRVIWTIDTGLLASILLGDNPLQDLVHKVPMILYYFVLPEQDVGDFTYVHDYDADTLLFRASAMGKYGRQVRPDGTTFVCCEVTTDIGSPAWEDPIAHAGRVWQEATTAGLVRGDHAIDTHILKTPVSYRLGKKGHGHVTRDLTRRIAAANACIVVCEQDACYRNDIMRELDFLSAA